LWFKLQVPFEIWGISLFIIKCRRFRRRARQSNYNKERKGGSAGGVGWTDVQVTLCINFGSQRKQNKDLTWIYSSSCKVLEISCCFSVFFSFASTAESASSSSRVSFSYVQVDDSLASSVDSNASGFMSTLRRVRHIVSKGRQYRFF